MAHRAIMYGSREGQIGWTSPTTRLPGSIWTSGLEVGTAGEDEYFDGQENLYCTPYIVRRTIAAVTSPYGFHACLRLSASRDNAGETMHADVTRESKPIDMSCRSFQSDVSMEPDRVSIDCC